MDDEGILVAKRQKIKVARVPGGLYRVANVGGGKPPKKYAGLFTNYNELLREVEAFNEGL